MADWVINPLKNDGYPALLELGEPPIFDVDTLFVEPKPRNIWTIDGSENDGYPVVAWQPPIPQFNVNTLFVPPKPRNIWNIHSGVNNGYPFIDWQFDIPPTGYDRNIPYYRYITTGGLTDLGVGNTTLLHGSLETAGYFGEVTLSDFANGEPGFTAWRWVDDQLGLATGLRQNQTENLLKFVHDGKIKFILKKTTRYNISWNRIFNAISGYNGDVYSSDMSNSASASQWQQYYNGKEIKIGGYTYKVRLIRGIGRVQDGTGSTENQIVQNSNNDVDKGSIWESVDSGVTGNWNANSRNEWNTLILPIHEASDNEGANKNDFSDPACAPDYVPSWDSFTHDELNFTGYGFRGFCQETPDHAIYNRITRVGTRRRETRISSASTTTISGFLGLRWVFDLVTNESTGVEEWRKLLRLNYYNGSTMKRAYSYRFWNGTGWV